LTSAIAVGSQIYVGDPANQNAELPGYWLANLHSSYQLRKDLQIFGVVNNLFNQKFGIYEPIAKLLSSRRISYSW